MSNPRGLPEYRDTGECGVPRLSCLRSVGSDSAIANRRPRPRAGVGSVFIIVSHGSAIARGYGLPG